MLCDNCKKREANVRYAENINGRKKELNLCEECSRKLGIGDIDFNLPINFNSFLGDFIEDFMAPDLLPMFNEVKKISCDDCGSTFEDIMNTGEFGCANCYDVFEDRIDPILKRVQGSNRHIGRIGKMLDNKIDKKMKDKENFQKGKEDATKETRDEKGMTEIEKLQSQLKQAIQEERYEDAAKLRDEIKKLQE